MNKVFCIISLSLMLSLPGNSQQLHVGLQAGIGTFSMQGLKEFNVIGMEKVPLFDTKVVEDFPVYINYRPYILLNIKKVSFGPVYTFQSTGSRISAKDYSGEYRFDMIVNSNSPGICGEVSLYSLYNINFSVSSVVGILFSNLRMKEYLKVQEELLTYDTYKFKSLNLFVEPGIKFSYPIEFLNIGIYGGYLIQFGNKSFYVDGNKDAELVNPESDDPIKPGWNGFRAGISVSWCIPLSLKLPAN